MRKETSICSRKFTTTKDLRRNMLQLVLYIKELSGHIDKAKDLLLLEL